MLLVVMVLAVLRIVNHPEKAVENRLDEMIQKLDILDMILSAKNLKKANRVARSRIKLQNVVNPKNLKVNVNDRGKYGKEN